MIETLENYVIMLPEILYASQRYGIFKQKAQICFDVLYPFFFIYILS